MPANLPPQYFVAEKSFREAKDPQEKIAALEEMIAVMPKHKGTDHLKAELRARIAKLTEQAGHHAGGTRASMTIVKEGAGQVAVVGLPNSGKSQLVTILTNATPQVADYPLTTHAATPGMMPYQDIQIQLIDTPPLAPQTMTWWLPPLLRRADALLLLADLSQDPVAQVEEMRQALEAMRIVIGTGRRDFDAESSTWYKRAVLAGNKSDLDAGGVGLYLLTETYGKAYPVTAISATTGRGLEELKRVLYAALDIIRVYTKAPGQKAEMTEPIVLHQGATLGEAAQALHKDFAAKLRFARIWGSGKHEGVMASRDHVLADGDIIELHIPR